MLEYIRSPKDIKALSDAQVTVLMDELRGEIIRTVAKTGGHLASNLGIVETTVALHRVFNSPGDSIIFDVGHQCYAHKLLTGRRESFSTLRTHGGVSGFTSREESEHDVLTAGHSGSALPIALGLARANALEGKDNYVVAVIGDGSFTNGMVYETINNCEKDLKLIIVLNDNEMSISPNVGGLPKYFTRLRNSKRYFKLKKSVQSLFQRIPLVGGKLVRAAYKTKEFIKHQLLHTNMFENMGLYYLGPADGNDEKKMEMLLEEAKTRDKVTIVHMMTLKGKGYAPAESQPDLYHFAGSFDPAVGAVAKHEESFSTVFAQSLCRLAEKDASVVAVTAAMDKGTGLSVFKERFPERFFDVGIAEECAATFTGGLAMGGKTPVCALYSTFLQRSYDQILEDIALQNVHAVIAVDRAGLVPGDGVTHQGVFDVALLSTVPGITIYSPETFKETEECLEGCVFGEGLCVLRYPKGAEEQYDRSGFALAGDGVLLEGDMDAEIVILTYSRVTKEAHRAALMLRKKYKTSTVKLVKLFPLDRNAVISACKNARVVCIVEEALRRGGMGEAVSSVLSEAGLSPRVCIIAVEGFLTHATVGELYEACGFSCDRIAERIESVMQE
ncbi:MAG: 1-deoxy-D-xylulose-5-phosphate synthase [Clostridia bacterium]|nr:1-deoxy-D-xylulose-5-phosphate synthase [Clostridia bacterium]